MKLNALKLALVVALLPVSASPNTRDESASSLLAELSQKVASKVHAYEGYFVSVQFAKSAVCDISVSHVRGRLVAGKFVQDSTVVSTDHFKVPASDIDLTTAELGALAGFTPRKVTDQFLDEMGRETVRFNCYGVGRGVRVSFWRDLETGFEVKSAAYSEDGTPLCVSYFQKLSIDPSSERHGNFPGFGAMHGRLVEFMRGRNGPGLDLDGLERFLRDQISELDGKY